MNRDSFVPLPPNQQLAAPGKWPIVGERNPRKSDAPWTLTISGLVEQPKIWTLDQILDMPLLDWAIDIHCVTRWSMLGAKFRGVSLEELLRNCIPSPQAKFVSFVARSERSHSTSLPLEESLALGAILATEFEGKPIESIHGGPIRMIVPGKYFYKSVKWIERIDLLALDRPGYWEADAGYHNTADPWREERYMAPNLDRNQVRDALANRNFAGLDLRSLDARGRDLSGLHAENALLRDANFQRCNLQRGKFAKANLSNGHLECADLRHASFENADVEGANFRGADLRHADLRGASLFGATFCPEVDPSPDGFGPAMMDPTTKMDQDSLNALTPHQFSFVKQAVFGIV